MLIRQERNLQLIICFVHVALPLLAAEEAVKYVCNSGFVVVPLFDKILTEL